MNWNPYQKFTWTKKELDSWVNSNGSRAFYDGSLWDIKSKKIANSKYYEVWFVTHKFPSKT